MAVTKILGIWNREHLLFYGGEFGITLFGMRMIGQLNGEAQARTFHDFLYVAGIDNQVEADKDGSWSIWVHAEEELGRAKEMLAAFQQNPADPKFQNNSATAEKLREEKRQEQARYEKRMKERRHLFQPMAAYGFGPVSFVLICICVILYVERQIGGSAVFDMLKITRFDIVNANQLTIWQGFLHRIHAFYAVIPEIRSGQVWRLVTPIFLHFGFFHIFTNMLCLRDMGSMIEARQGSAWLVLMVVALGMVSNLAQYFVTGGDFGGMSGVVYGLLGYIWIRGKLDPGSGLYVHPTTVTMMIIWFFVCMVAINGIANACHATGLIMGMAWGFLSSLRHR